MGLIRLPNERSLISAATAYAGVVAELIGFSKWDSNRIQLAVEEACLNVIKQSFGVDEESEFDIRFINRPDGIEICIHDMGLPYDPDAEPVFDPDSESDKLNTEGLGTFLIRKTMDEYRYNNLGVKGKEVVFIKYLNTKSVVPEGVEPAEPEAVPPPAQDKEIEKYEFNIRLMKQNEAVEVCRCIYDCYGYSYANENMYFPERVAAMNLQGKLISVVAVTGDNDIGGHCGLIFYDLLPPELGIVVTKKKYRGQGFARQLSEFTELQALKRSVGGIQVKEVTAHPYTQKLCQKLGYKDCGMLLGHSPKSLSFKGIADTLIQRNSDVLGFKYLAKPVKRKIYAPMHHRSMIELLFENIGDDVECILDKNPQPSGEKCVMEVKVHSLRSLAEMIVMEYGPDTMQVMRNEMRKVFRDEIQVIELYLNLRDPMTPQIVPQLESLGFLFTGILPETCHGDSLVMQYFNGVFIDYDKIVLVSDVANQLLDYVRHNDRMM